MVRVRERGGICHGFSIHAPNIDDKRLLLMNVRSLVSTAVVPASLPCMRGRTARSVRCGKCSFRNQPLKQL
eukprot:311155-Chlamydomonas_euryale.AAC.3